MASYEDLWCAGSLIRYDPEFLTPVDPRVFDPLSLAQQGHKMGSAAGLGEVHFVRRGSMRHVIRDLFIRWRFEAVRLMREFELTSWIRTHGLPVPKAVAAQIHWVGTLLYRAAILNAWIAGAQPLRTGPLDASWRLRMGQTVHQMLHIGVCHSDLNHRSTLMAGVGALWLIDFDKCASRVPGAWMQRNLDRLHRSLCKGDGQGALLWRPANRTALFAGNRTGARP